ncbi:unnamed protein product [Soboliphyme baturini]|uniref:Uncharacterized protein n=1 Tax=Soboliphyme baturini TaxID=241478 RepID=A0A183IHU6_9BILA|nr:unnamed protein product [Soboliphyme baturini]
MCCIAEVPVRRCNHRSTWSADADQDVARARTGRSSPCKTAPPWLFDDVTQQTEHLRHGVEFCALNTLCRHLAPWSVEETGHIGIKLRYSVAGATEQRYWVSAFK